VASSASEPEGDRSWNTGRKMQVRELGSSTASIRKTTSSTGVLKEIIQATYTRFVSRARNLPSRHLIPDEPQYAKTKQSLTIERPDRVICFFAVPSVLCHCSRPHYSSSATSLRRKYYAVLRDAHELGLWSWDVTILGAASGIDADEKPAVAAMEPPL